MIRLLWVVMLVLAASALPAGGAMAQADLAAAKAQGQIGERPDGLVGAVNPSTAAAVQALVQRVNAERMALYRQIAQRNNAPIDAVQRAAGERLTGETPPGQYYMDANQRWQRR